MKKTALILVCFCLFLNKAFSQDPQTRYLSGKDYLKKGKYQVAMEAFKPLLSESPDNPYIYYAYYFYSLSALKAGKIEEARQTIKQLLLKNPHWEKKQEANYLLGNILFEQGKFREALEALQEIDNKEIRNDAEALKASYLATMTNVESLKWLQQQFPRDKEVAKVLAAQLATSSEEKDRIHLNYLIEEFRLDKNKLTPSITSVKKKEYKVAVLFPFMIDKLNTDNVNRPNQFILDMYQGVKLAADSLAKEGLKISVYAYDTEKEPEKFLKLLQESEIGKMDMIIGPVYPAHIPILGGFASKNGIQVVSPFHYNLETVKGNPFFFLFQPAYEFQSQQAADYIMNKYKPAVKYVETEKTKGKKTEVPVVNSNVIIFYGESDKDSIMAFSYQSAIDSANAHALKTDSLLKVSHFEKITRENVGRIKVILTDSALMSTVNHIFVISQDQVIAANVISSTEISGFNVPIFTTSDWLDFNLLTVEQFERRNVHFIYPDYIDFEKTGVRLFKNKYLKQTHFYPTTFAYQGYDLMYLFGKMLQSYGTYFAPGLKDAGFLPGNTLAGFNYEEAQSNRFVPIVKFINGKLEIVNTVLTMERK